MARGNSDRTLESDRAFMEEWCYVWSNYSRDYYKRLSDTELTQLYEELNNKINEKQQAIVKKTR